MNLEDITKLSHYQTFDFLGGPQKDSNSGKKYELSRLDLMDLKGKDVLDVGCNAGYFLFRLFPKEPAFMLGIDAGQKFITVANQINDGFFKTDKAIFICDDFFTYEFPILFDLIFCFSTFHYFGDKQALFFDMAYKLSKPSATLLLEVEEYPLNDFPQVDRSIRPADKKSYPYPNMQQILKWAEGKWILNEKYQSVTQGGSLYDRFFYRFTKA